MLWTRGFALSAVSPHPRSDVFIRRTEAQAATIAADYRARLVSKNIFFSASGTLLSPNFSGVFFYAASRKENLRQLSGCHTFNCRGDRRRAGADTQDSAPIRTGGRSVGGATI